jgi:hypothetical protein
VNTATIPRYPVTIDGETTHIGTADELAVALDVLHGRHDRAVLEQLRPHLADITATPIGLELVLKSFAPADQEFLIDALGARLAGILQEARYLRDLLATLADVQVEEHLLNTLGTPGLRALIVTAEHLSEVLEWVYGQCDTLLLDLLGADYVRGLVHNSYELALMLNSMERAMQSALIEQTGWERVVELVTDGRDLAYLMRALPSALGAQLLERFSRDQLLDVIHNASDWRYLWERLDSTEAEALSQRLAPVPRASLRGKGTDADAA